MNLTELLAKLDTPIVIRPTRRMTQGELETYLDKAADILRGNADHSEFRGYVFALLLLRPTVDWSDWPKLFEQGCLDVIWTVPGSHAMWVARAP
jgi:type I restriction enzyme M protein